MGLRIWLYWYYHNGWSRHFFWIPLRLIILLYLSDFIFPYKSYGYCSSVCIWQIIFQIGNTKLLKFGMYWVNIRCIAHSLKNNEAGCSKCPLKSRVLGVAVSALGMVAMSAAMLGGNGLYQAWLRAHVLGGHEHLFLTALLGSLCWWPVSGRLLFNCGSSLTAFLIG